MSEKKGEMAVVRFAPSPTGFLHLGSARTALFNWLYARHAGGKFLLRIEDTDRARSEKRFLDEILRDLKWMGLDWDGEPIYQSRRFELYREEAEKILKKGLAYTDGDAILFKVEKGRAIEVDDIIHGKITFNTDNIKDQVMIKSDGSPAYNFSCVVDDSQQGVTHVIRGDDHISNTPKQMLFYGVLGADMPCFAHMPLMMGADGAKLSKRHGAVAVEEYKKEGFLPEALVNYLMLLGWTPEGDREIISLKEAVKEFKIEDMSDVQARFDTQKLTWINGEHMMRKTSEELIPLVKESLMTSGIDPAAMDEEFILKLIELYKVRVKTVKEFTELTDYFFKNDFTQDEKGRKKHLDKEENRENLRIFADKINALDVFSAANIEAVCRAIAEEKDLKAAGIIHPTRMAISGKMKGAGLFEVMELLGKEKVVERMKRASGHAG
ncbi:MAG: glutamate--tRNA ligase [Candidatus Omnitrophota bacterium]